VVKQWPAPAGCGGSPLMIRGPVVYQPPSGWVESRPHEPGADGEARSFGRFHTTPDCPRIRNAQGLRPVDRPYSAARCSACASPGADPSPYTAIPTHG